MSDAYLSEVTFPSSLYQIKLYRMRVFFLVAVHLWTYSYAKPISHVYYSTRCLFTGELSLLEFKQKISCRFMETTSFA